MSSREYGELLYMPLELAQTELPRLPDTLVTPHEHVISFVCFSLHLSPWPQKASIVLALDGICSLCETSKLLCAFRKLSPEPPLTYFLTQMFPPQIEVHVQNVGSLLIPTLSETIQG